MDFRFHVHNIFDVMFLLPIMFSYLQTLGLDLQSFKYVYYNRKENDQRSAILASREENPYMTMDSHHKG